MKTATVLAIVLLALTGCGGSSSEPAVDPVSARFTETAVEINFRAAQTATAATIRVAQAATSEAGLALTQMAIANGASVIRNADWTPVERDFDGVPMMLVPAGCFDMGSTTYDNEKPVHRICFDTPYWIDKTEVTQMQFRVLGGSKANANAFSGDNRPVERITWFEARDYCTRRGARLPSEAEWEYAARGPDSLTYPWGETFVDANTVYADNSGSQTADVGSKPAGASWVGAQDMSGNVREWTSSLYSPYPYDASDGREADTGNRTDIRRMLRGGSWFGSYSFNLRAPDRFDGSPGDRNGDVGLRCVRSF